MSPTRPLCAYKVATAATAAGPFELGANVTLRHPTFTSAELFVDDDGAGYLLYASRQQQGAGVS